MALKSIKRKVRIKENLRFPYDRRSGVDRRCISYDHHIPERRRVANRRACGERRKDWIRVCQWASAWRELLEPEDSLDD